MSNKLALFIEKANMLHNHKYIYDKFIYVNSKTKSVITCIKHGNFNQSPSAHLRGHGCGACSRNSLLSTSEFIRRSKKIHNNIYNYNKTNYVNAKTKVIITCKKHGDFSQNPDSHLRGFGCSHCGNIKKSISQLMTHDEFIKKANNVHNNKYDYNGFIYKGSHKQGIIICPNHGSFTQTPASHLAGHGCKKCFKRCKLTLDIFIERANQVHNGIYKYEKFIYKDSHTKGIITCIVHGDFQQRPTNHLDGRGCSKCVSNVSAQETKWLDSLQIPNENRNQVIIVNGSKFNVDAIIGKTIYEFYGDFWHGNPSKFNHDDINYINKISFGKLYQNTIKREKMLRKNGYKVITIWESDWKEKTVRHG